jgi:hypothetical protein
MEMAVQVAVVVIKPLAVVQEIHLLHQIQQLQLKEITEELLRL